MNLPNLITLSRLIFLFIIAYLAGQTWSGAAILTFTLSLIAAISDFVDGYIARKYNLITDFGKLFDAIVDKVMVIGLFLILFQTPYLDFGGTPWMRNLAIFIIAATVIRDLAITGLRMAAAKKGVVLAADKIGKRKTIWQITSICVLLFVPVAYRDIPQIFGVDATAFGNWVWCNGIIYFYFSGALMLYSGILYVGRYLPIILKNPPKNS